MRRRPAITIRHGNPMRLLSRLIIPTLVLPLFFLAGCAGLQPAGLVLGDRVIDSEETWSGIVRINGIVTVKKMEN